ncbi:MAG: oligosaccharide flippase family protein, partial [Candidatus Palauibacterales bacterium]|nr:oligosaccharide flippase family protein [Candidatus Palauibacterales bacterium]
RALGTDLYGVYGFVLGVVALFAFAVRMNLAVLFSREVARAPETAGARLGLGLVTTAALGLAATLPIAGWVAVQDGRPAVVGAAALAGLALTVSSLHFAAQGVFQGLQRTRALLPSAVAGRLVLVGATVGAVELGLGLPGVFAAQALGWAAALALLLALFRSRIGPLPLRFPARRMAGLVREARSFGLNNLFGAIYLAADVLLLKAFRTDHEVGIYRAAAVLILQLPLVASVLNQALLPRLARRVGDPEGAGRELSFALRVLLAASVPMAVGGLCVARPLVVLLASPAYRAAWVPLAIMLPILPLRYANSAVSTALSALDRQPDRTRGTLYAALFNVAANLVAIPRWGVAGAAATTTLTELLLAAWLAGRARGVTRGVRVTGPLARSGAAAAGMAVLLLATPGWPVALRVAAGAAAYAVLGRLTGAWNPADLRRLARL